MRIALSAVVLLGLAVSSIWLLQPDLVIRALHLWFVRTETEDALRTRLMPHVDLRVPDSPGPHRLVVLVPGCLGWRGQMEHWRQFFSERGFATLHVDSFTPRGLTSPRDLEAQVCEGQSVFGFERAGDLLAVLRVVWRRADLAGPTVFVGESHGGWTVSDFYALAGGGLVPPNIAGGVAAPKDRLGPAFLFYPYCGFGSLDGDAGWPPGVKLTVFLGGQDTNTDLVPCRQRIARRKSRGAAVNEVVFPDATHWFDNDRDFDLLPHRFDESATRDAAQHIDAVLAGR